MNKIEINAVTGEVTEIPLTEEELAEIEEKRLADALHEQMYGYIEKRKAAYPSITEQLDMLYHDKVNGTAKWEATIATIKATYPKPE